MENYNPVESVTEAFTDLGKRVTAFFICFFTGIIQGVVAFLINNTFHRSTPAAQLSPAQEVEWYEETTRKFFDIPEFTLIALGIAGCAGTCMGMVRIIQGSTKLSVRLMTILGSSMLSILMSQRLGWEMGSTLWIALVGFLLLDLIALKQWQKSDNKKWEAELEVIREENLRKRQEKEIKLDKKTDKELAEEE